MAKRTNEFKLTAEEYKEILKNIEEDVDEEKVVKPKFPTRGRPPKRLKQGRETPIKVLRESYVMTAFGRKVDLSKFTENSTLYSLSRAWAHNKPDEKISPQNKQNNVEMTREKMPESEQKIVEKEIGDVVKMPAPEPMAVDKDVPPEKKVLDFEVNNTNLSREELLKSHKSQWSKCKQLQREKIKEKRSRCQLSSTLLDAVI